MENHQTTGTIGRGRAKTIEHYSGKGGKNLSGVYYYEVWNEPDLAQFGSWKMGGKNYLTLYHYGRVRREQSGTGVNQFYLGGPFLLQDP